ncbi:hypothetical protein [Pseudomonas koreensis]|uniref:hypothetical protein n=2 Tax=Pseudomonas TaxID=286 RepID=UPI0014136A84|nr:hypothetical protein [Pseudomonas koreensis]NHX02144.1 hypothetical protein [Pseudomonas koreensis]
MKNKSVPFLSEMENIRTYEGERNMSMKIIKPGKATITVEANSPQALEKLLEQALFELKLSSTDDDGFQQALSKTTEGVQAGSLGSYSFQYIAPEVDRDEFF